MDNRPTPVIDSLDVLHVELRELSNDIKSIRSDISYIKASLVAVNDLARIKNQCPKEQVEISKGWFY